jgi:hypothetical protein
LAPAGEALRKGHYPSTFLAEKKGEEKKLGAKI